MSLETVRQLLVWPVEEREGSRRLGGRRWAPAGVVVVRGTAGLAQVSEIPIMNNETPTLDDGAPEVSSDLIYILRGATLDI